MRKYVLFLFKNISLSGKNWLSLTGYQIIFLEELDIF